MYTEVPEMCRQEADIGTCSESVPRFFYNTESEACEEFTYGGCGGNDNNFESMTDCDFGCRGGMCPALCSMYCEHGMKRDHNGCQICECEGKI